MTDPHEIHPSEAAFLDGLTFRFPNPHIFDVGANIGGWTAAVLARWPEADVVCFEPNPTALLGLQKRLDFGVFVAPFALSDEVGKAWLYHDGDADALASLHKRDLGFQDQTHGSLRQEVQVQTLDQWLKGREVDLLKIDVEGNELSVLLGAGRHLSNCRSIYWEVNSCNLASRTFFKDFWDLLFPRFAIYQVMSDGKLSPEIIKYTPSLEDFAAHRDFFARRRGPDQ